MLRPCEPHWCTDHDAYRQWLEARYPMPSPEHELDAYEQWAVFIRSTAIRLASVARLAGRMRITHRYPGVQHYCTR